METPIGDAYREACAALGESLVHRRLLEAEVRRLRSEAADLAGVLSRRDIDPKMRPRPQVPPTPTQPPSDFPPAPVQSLPTQEALPPRRADDLPRKARP